MENESARDSDGVLYFEVCKQINPVVAGMTFKDVMNEAELFSIPSFESVSRCRRHIVESNPDLRGSKRATDARFKKWKEIREYVATE